jgi:hypothetical protein
MPKTKSDSDERWDINDVYQHLLSALDNTEEALPTLWTAIHSGLLPITATQYDAGGAIVAQHELELHWYQHSLALHLRDGRADLFPTRALDHFDETTFTVPASLVRKRRPISPTAKAERDCGDWLMELARGSSDKPPKTKPVLLKEAQSRWPKLSERGFNREWAKVVQAGAKWDRPGRP